MKTYQTRFLRGANFVTRFILLFIFWELANTNSTAQVQVRWHQTNGPEGGRINTLAINASGDIFAGTYGGGVFRSTDNGDSWTAVNSGLTNTSVYVNALAIHPSGDIFAGTKGGIFRSTNRGASWTAVNSGLTITTVNALAVNASGDVFAATSNIRDSGVFRLLNDGNVWIAINNGLPNTAVNALAINKRSGDIFAGVSDDLTDFFDVGVFRRKNNGASWAAASNSPRNTTVKALAINASEHIFAGTDRRGVFRSMDDGTSWTAVNNGLTNTSVNAFAINANGDIFVGTDGGGVFRSTDNGDNWTAVNNGLRNTSVSAIVINANGDIFVGTDGSGVFRSTSNGNNWTAVNNNLTGTYVQAVAINEATNDIFAGTDGGGVFRSTNNGDNWTTVNNGLTSLHVEALAINEVTKSIFAGTLGGGVFRSTNNGDDWTAVNIGLTYTTVVALAINASGHIFAGTPGGGGVFLSTDNGDTWAEANRFLTDRMVRSLAIDALGGIFAGTVNGKVFRSVINVDMWTEVSSGLPSTPIYTLTVNTSGAILAGTGGDGVFRATNNDGSYSWTAANNGLTHTVVNAITGNMSGDIFAGTSFGGVFRSTNNGNNWVANNSGLTNTDVIAIAINASETIFAGTIGNGVFRGVDYPLTIPLEKTYNFSTHNNASDYKVSDYRIVGLPGESNKFLKEFLNGDQGRDWQIYRDNGSNSMDPNVFLDEFDSSDKFRFKVGRAFWLISRDTVTIATTAKAATLNLNQEAQIDSLHPGWNLIANPFNRPVDWSTVQAANSTSEQIHAFTGTFRTSAILEPYVGYYFYNDDPARSILRVPLSAVSPISIPVRASKHSVWEVEIGLASKDNLDQSTSFGVANEAKQELDQFDYRKPRAVAAIPTAYFSKPKWDKHYSTFATDIRPAFEEKESWDFEVQSAQREELKLTFSGIERVPSQFDVYLLDEVRACHVNLRQDSVYSFVPATDISKFQVLVGKIELLQEKLNGVVPKQFALEQNFPNPFLGGAKSRFAGNPSTVIPVTVPVTTEVKLKIYDFMGREVKTLHDGNLTPGRYFFLWDGEDTAGHALASGVYFYRLTTSSNFSRTQKMILLK